MKRLLFAALSLAACDRAGADVAPTSNEPTVAITAAEASPAMPIDGCTFAGRTRAFAPPPKAIGDADPNTPGPAWTPLARGRVAIVADDATILVLDPRTGWSSSPRVEAPAKNFERWAFAVAIDDDRVLVGGDVHCDDDRCGSEALAIYDTRTTTWIRAQPASEPLGPGTVVAPDAGGALIVGRSLHHYHGGTLRTLSAVPSHLHGTATTLADGTVLLTGGSAHRTPHGTRAVSIVDARSGTVSSERGWSLAQPRAQHVAVRLGDGRVLIAGGGDSATGWQQSVEVFDPATRAVTVLSYELPARRVAQAAALLPCGAIVLVGGMNGDVPLPTSRDRMLPLDEVLVTSMRGGAFLRASLDVARTKPVLLPTTEGLLVLGGGGSHDAATTAELLF